MGQGGHETPKLKSGLIGKQVDETYMPETKTLSPERGLTLNATFGAVLLFSSGGSDNHVHSE